MGLLLFLSCYSVFAYAWTLPLTVLNGEVKTVAAPLQVEMQIQALISDNNADLYVALLLTDQSLWFLSSNTLFEQGIWSREATAYQRDLSALLTTGRQGLVVDLPALPALPDGRYTFFAVATKTGIADVADDNNWLSPLSQVSFQIGTVQADIPTDTVPPIDTPPDNPPQLDNALPIPAQLFGEANDQGELVFPLTLQRGQKTFLEGTQTSTLGVNGDYLGPTIRVNRGDKVRMQVTNQIGEVTTLHWHGLHIPANMDGGPHQMIPNGETWLPHFNINQPAGTFWYHPHLEGKTSEHVYRGLAGLYIVDDENSAQLALPKTYGQDDIPLIIQDRRIADNGDMTYQILSTRDIMQGMKGDKILVNGAIRSTLYAGAEMLRLRILNGSNARVYNLGFDDNRTFYHIATDSGLLEKPVETKRIRLAAAERAEILVDLRSDFGRRLILKSYSSEITAVISSNSNLYDDLDTQNFDIMDINVNQNHQNGLSVPEQLVRFNRLDSNNAVTTRQFVLSMRQQNLTINGKKMDMERIDATVKLNTTEIW